MKFTISLNTEREILYALPSIEVQLTAAHPDVELDTDLLDQAHKISIAGAIRINRIKSTLDADSISSNGTSPVFKPQPAIVAPTESADSLALKAREILSGHLATVKKEVLNVTDIRFIKMLLAVEQGNKKRSSILKLIQDKLAANEATIKKAIELKAAGSALLIQDPSSLIIKGQSVRYNVTEELGEKITIQVKPTD